MDLQIRPIFRFIGDTRRVGRLNLIENSHTFIGHAWGVPEATRGASGNSWGFDYIAQMCLLQNFANFFVNSPIWLFFVRNRQIGDLAIKKIQNVNFYH